MPKDFQKGNTPWNKGLKFIYKPRPNAIGRIAWNKGIKLPKLSGKRSSVWKGDNAGYGAKHIWIVAHFGKASKCENPNCFYPRKDMRGYIMEKPKRFEWANISGKYKRRRNDWKELCPSCHRKYDEGKVKVIH
jgi:hypothetical protein